MLISLGNLKDTAVEARDLYKAGIHSPSGLFRPEMKDEATAGKI